MKHIILTAKAILFLVLVFFVQGFSNRPGGDYYKVLLNNKLLTEQFLYKPIALKTVSLTASNNNDQLTVYYSHCGTAGSGRTISLKSSSGKLLAKWDFSDSKGIALQLAVKDLLKAATKNSSGCLYYASKEIPAGKPLITIEFSNKVVATL